MRESLLMASLVNVTSYTWSNQGFAGEGRFDACLFIQKLIQISKEQTDFYGFKKNHRMDIVIVEV